MAYFQADPFAILMSDNDDPVQRLGEAWQAAEARTPWDAEAVAAEREWINGALAWKHDWLLNQQAARSEFTC